MDSGSTTGMSVFPWYRVVEDETLEQGDFFFRFPVFEPVYPEQIVPGTTGPEVDLTFYDVIVLSQSCDLVQGKLESVLVCPHFDLGQAAGVIPPYREHLAQAFARFIMRVGLPEDIPPFRAAGKR